MSVEEEDVGEKSNQRRKDAGIVVGVDMWKDVIYIIAKLQTDQA